MRWFGPGLFNGIILGQWLRLLVRNRGRIGLPYLGRGAVISFAAAGNSVFRLVEQLRFGRAIDQVTVHPPLFVLGVWRSGTTHLHNLLCQDDRLAFPNSKLRALVEADACDDSQQAFVRDIVAAWGNVMNLNR